MKLLSREDALASGSTTYFTGKPCRNGHISPRNAKTRHCNKCMEERNRRNGRKSRERSRHDRPWVILIRGVRSRAKQRGVPFSLTKEWAEERWTGKCEITGLPFDLGMSGSGPNTRSPSIDRIDPSKGYYPDNCRIVLHCVNALKQSEGDIEMKEVVNALYNYFK